MDLAQLGTPSGPLTRVAGGFANRVYRLDTDQGSFAVKELNLARRSGQTRAEDVLRFELAAFGAGVPMPEPVSVSQDTVIHRWVEGDRVPEAPVTHSYAFEVGQILAHIHGLDVEWKDSAGPESTPRDWSELAENASATGQPWAAELEQRRETFLAIADFVDTCERPGPRVLTHGDIQPWNLLSRDGRPVLLDWELSDRLDLAGELGAMALSLAKGPGFDGIEPDVFASVLDGYVACGGVLPPSGPSWFVYLVSGWLRHLRRNVLRCLAGVEDDTGPDLALSTKIVDDGVRGLPELYGRLPELETLLP